MGKLNFEQLTDLFLLLSVERIGPAKIRNLLARFKNLTNVLSASTSELTETEGISKELASRIRKISSQKEVIQNFLEKELKVLEKLNGRIITVWDEDYPPLLKKIYDPPLVLYILGQFDEKDKYSIAVVGTRQPTNYGKIQTEKIVNDLAEQKITIVSGMARGIDSIAHRIALKNKSRTMPVVCKNNFRKFSSRSKLSTCKT